MRKWNAALSYGLVLMFISCFSISNGLDYEDDDQKLDPFSRCPWIRNKLKNGRVRIRSRGRIAKFSCKSGYDLVGKRFATCVRGQWNGPIPMCVTKGCRKQAAPRNGKVKELNQGAALSFECNPGYSLVGDATIYCDGSQWDKEPPKCQVTTLQPAIFCDFEDPDLCGWTHDPTHDFDWKRNQFGTPSGHVGTGPSYDHTYGKGKAGFYMYGEASAPRNENDTSRLFSPVYSRYYSPGCFVFWYHMYGATIGALRIYFKKESSVFAELSPSWEKHGDQGNQWLRGNVTVPTMNENFQVVIEGIRGHSYVGDTAIDDVSLMHNNCSSLDSSNSTEDVEVASQDSCRGRCHEPDNSTSCGCTDACESDNTCCSDYDKLCAEKGETSNGEDEYLQSTAKPETEATPELTVTDMVGTPLTARPAKLYTEAEANSTYSTNMPEKNTQQPTITANTPRVTTVLLSTGVVTQTTNKPITTKTTEELKTKTTLIPTVPVEKVSVKTETTGVLTVTSRNPTKLTTEKPTTVSKVSTVLSTVLIATVKASTAVTTPTTTAATTKEPPAIIQTFGSSAPPELNATDSKVSSSTLVMVPTTAAMVTSKTNLPSSPTTGIPNNTLSSEKLFTPPVITFPAALNTPTTLQVRTSETVKPTPSATKSVISFSKATTYTTVIDTQSTGRDLKVPTTLKVVPTTLKVVPTTLTTETRLTSTTPLPVVFPKTPTTKTVRTSPSTTPRPVVTTKTTARLKPTVAMITTGLPAGFVSTLKNTRKLKTTTKHTSSLRTTESQTMKSNKEMDVPHASKAKADVPQNYSVIGVCVGLIVVAGLVGGAVYFYQRRRNAQSRLRDDSEMRFLPDSEVIEYSDATVLDNLVHS